ncbi:hypothetical protein M441DRAFT_115609, partial [Trichoderma asperellum CBS 433.97]
MLQNIDEAFKPPVIASLKWLACSIEPLKIGLLAEIFVLPSTPNDGFEEISPLFSPVDVLKYFPGLIVVQGGNAWETRGERRKDLHYLTSDRIFQGPASSFAFTESDAHMHIGRLCLAYHLHRSSMTRISNFNQHNNYYKKKLMEYASRNWAEHLEMIPQASWPPEVSRNAVLSLSIRSQSLVTIAGNYYPNKVLIWRPHCYTALRGFRQLTEILISGGVGVSKYLTQVDLDEGLPTFDQARNLEVLQMLLNHGADVHATGGYYGTVLQAACAIQYRDIVRFLINHGVAVNAQGGRYGTALQAACAVGDSWIAQLLLDN